MTEKNYNPNQKEKNAMKKQPKKKEVKLVETKEKKTPEIQKEEEKEIKMPISEEGTDEKKDEEKKEIKKPSKKVKKDEVCVNAKSVQVSTKYAIEICKFLKTKKVEDAIKDLEQVILLKKSVPMKGEYAHRKGKGNSGGSFPQRASKQFIVLLKSLRGNANNHEIDNPVITEARANWAPSPRGKFGRVKRKRTHITLKAKEMKIKEKKK